MPRTSSHTFMKVKRSTLAGIWVSWAFVKWNSELARVFKAKKSVTKFEFLTFAALFLSDLTETLQVIEGEDVLQFRVGEDN